MEQVNTYFQNKMTKTTNYINQLIGIADACKLIGTKFSSVPMYPQLLRHYLLHDEGPAFQRIGKHYFFLRSDIENWQKPERQRPRPKRKYED